MTPARRFRLPTVVGTARTLARTAALAVLAVVGALAAPAAALAQGPGPAPAAPASLGRLLLDASLFGIGGIVLLIIGYYIWELITPYNVRKELHENKNVAVAIVVASFIIGMAIVIAASLILIK